MGNLITLTKNLLLLIINEIYSHLNEYKNNKLNY